jgi:hypothetical protein
LPIPQSSSHARIAFIIFAYLPLAFRKLRTLITFDRNFQNIQVFQILEYLKVKILRLSR